MGSPLGLEGTSKIYSYLSVFMGSASANSNSDGSKIFEKKCCIGTDRYYVVRSIMFMSILNTDRLFVVIIPYTIQFNYLHNIYIVWGIWVIQNNLYMGDVHRSYANTTPFYMKDLSILGFEYLQESWELYLLYLMVNVHIIWNKDRVSLMNFSIWKEKEWMINHSKDLDGIFFISFLLANWQFSKVMSFL